MRQSHLRTVCRFDKAGTARLPTPAAIELLDGPGAAGDDASATGALRSRFAALRRRLSDATLEHFNLDASSAGGLKLVLQYNAFLAAAVR